MKLKKLLETSEDLLDHMQESNYSHEYIMCFSRELRWIEKNIAEYQVSSYEELCQMRLHQSKPYEESHIRSMYGVFKRFEENGEFPDRKMHGTVFERATYHKLSPYFKCLVDMYTDYAKNNVHQESTISKCRSKSSCFFMHLQNLGYTSLEHVKEKDVLSFFATKDGESIRGRSYKRDIAIVLNSELKDQSIHARRIVDLLPAIPQKHKNIKFLTAEESDAIHEMLSSEACPLTLRDRAIGFLLYFTGIRAGDIADLRMNEIDWRSDKIVRRQHKTGNLLELPLIPVVGNAIYNYISKERPASEEDHLFLWSKAPYTALSSNAVWQICRKIYTASGVRQNPGDRKGSHIFRHHLATHLAGQGFAQPVISDTLGHSEPMTLSYYLSADITHLRELALSIDAFPVSEEVFKA